MYNLTEYKFQLSFWKLRANDMSKRCDLDSSMTELHSFQIVRSIQAYLVLIGSRRMRGFLSKNLNMNKGIKLTIILLVLNAISLK